MICFFTIILFSKIETVLPYPSLDFSDPGTLYRSVAPVNVGVNSDFFVTPAVKTEKFFSTDFSVEDQTQISLGNPKGLVSTNTTQALEEYAGQIYALQAPSDAS